MVRAVIQEYRGPQVAAKEYNQDELSRLMVALRQLTVESQTHQARLQVAQVLRVNGAALKFDVLNRVSPPTAGLLVVLPRASETDGGRSVEVACLSSAGAVTYAVTSGLVNGATSFAPGAGVGLLRFRWDGSGWYV